MNLANFTGKTGGYVEKTVINDCFVQDLRRVKPLTATEEYKLFEDLEASKARVIAAKDSDNYLQIKSMEEKIQLDIRNEIITRNQYLNYAIAKRYNNTDIVMELVNVGAIGMIEAFDKYDYKSGNRFCTYATYYIRRAVNAYLQKDNLMIRTTNNTKIISKVKIIENEFFITEGRYPTPYEVKNILASKYNIYDVDILDLNMAEVNSIDATMSSDEDNFIVEDSADYNTKTASYNDYIQEENLEEKQALINNLFKHLTNREKTIVSMAAGYGYERDYKDNEIADIMDMSSERVRQIRLAAIKKLQKYAAVAAF